MSVEGRAKAGFSLVNALILHRSSLPVMRKQEFMTFTKKILYIFTLLLLICPSDVVAQKVEKGIASYYSANLRGRRTSDGSIYHKDSLTCAHKTLPFGTLLKVTNKKNNKIVVVKVTDRGPFGPGRIVDLSWAAAKELEMLAQGIVPCEAEIVDHEYKANWMANRGGVEIQREKLELPQFKYVDIATGRYYTAQEWSEREKKQRENARNYVIKNDNITAKAQMPVLNLGFDR